MKKQVLLSLMAIGVMATLVSSATFAYFTDTEISTGNTFEAGTIDIYLTDGGPSANYQWYVTDWKPGETPVPGEIRIFSMGKNKGDHLEIEFNTTLYEDDDGTPESDPNDYTPGPESDTNPDPVTGADGMDADIKIRDMYYRHWENGMPSDTQYLIDTNYQPTPLGVTYGLHDTNSNGYMDLEDLETLGIDNIPPPELDDGSETTFMEFGFTASFNPDAGSDFQGDICLLDIIVTLNQVDIQ